MEPHWEGRAGEESRHFFSTTSDSISTVTKSKRCSAVGAAGGK